MDQAFMRDALELATERLAQRTARPADVRPRARAPRPRRRVLRPGPAEAQKPKEIVMVNWGGDALKHFYDAWGKPYETDTGIKVVVDGTGPFCRQDARDGRGQERHLGRTTPAPAPASSSVSRASSTSSTTRWSTPRRCRPGDRRVPAQPGGGGMSVPGAPPDEGDRAGRRQRPDAGPRPDGRRHGRPEGAWTSGRRRSGCCADGARAVQGGRRRGAGDRQRHADGARPAAARARDRPRVRRLPRPAAPRGDHQGAGGRGRRDAGATASSPTAARRRHWCPGRASTSTPSRHVLLLVLAVYVAASVLAWLQGYLLNDVVQSTVRRMRSDVEDKVNRAAAAVLRPAAPRRAAQPGHQRHRQRQPDPAADDEPAADLAAHGRRACWR